MPAQYQGKGRRMTIDLYNITRALEEIIEKAGNCFAKVEKIYTLDGMPGRRFRIEFSCKSFLPPPARLSGVDVFSCRMVK